MTKYHVDGLIFQSFIELKAYFDTIVIVRWKENLLQSVKKQSEKIRLTQDETTEVLEYAKEKYNENVCKSVFVFWFDNVVKKVNE